MSAGKVMKIKNNLELKLLVLIIILGGFFRFYSLGAENLHHDEAYHVNAALSGNLAEVSEKTIRYFEHPVLLNVMLYAWAQFGSSEFYLRSLQAIAGTLGILLIFLISREIFNEKVGLLSALIFSLSPEHIRFAQEFRGYAIATLFVMASFYFFVKAIKQDKNKYWFFYALFGILTPNTDYFAGAYLAAVFLFFIINIKKYKHILKKFIFIESLMLIFVLPNIFPFLIQASIAPFWAEASLSPLWKILIIPYNFYVFTLGHYQPYMANFSWKVGLRHLPLLLIIFGFITYFFIKALIPLKKNSEKILLLLVLFVPFIIAYIISSLSYFSLEPYHFLAVSFPYYIFIAKGIFSVKNKKLFTIAIISIIAISLVSINAYYSSEKPSWKAAADYIKENEKQGDAVGIFPLFLSVPFEYYYKGSLDVYGIPYQYMPVKEYSWKNLELEPFDYSKPRIITEDVLKGFLNTTVKKHSRLWLIRTYIRDQSGEEMITNYLNKNYVLLGKKTFSKKSDYIIEAYLYDLRRGS